MGGGRGTFWVRSTVVGVRFLCLAAVVVPVPLPLLVVACFCNGDGEREGGEEGV